MEYVNKVMVLADKAASNNTVINCFLFSVFGALSVRSFNQQSKIETLETQKESLLKSNKEIKKTIWDWKQQLYAQAETNSVIPIAKIKQIYGDAPTIPPAGVVVQADSGSPPRKILI